MVFAFHLKAKAIFQYAKLGSCRKVASNIGCSKSSISNWTKDINDYTNYIKSSSNRHSYKINKTILETIRDSVTKNNFLKLNQIQSIIEETLGITLSLESIRKCLKIQKFSRKRIKKIVVKSKEYYQNLKNQREQFIKRIKSLQIDNIISIDESSFNKEMKESYGYSEIGKPVIQTTTSQRHQKYSLLMAITNNKVLSYQIHKGSINKEIYYSFLNSMITELRKEEKNYYFLMDNVSFHHSHTIKKLISDNNYQIIYTPPYSPELNPIEMTFSVLKNNFKSTNIEHSLISFVNTIDTLIARISNTNYLSKLFKYSFTLSNHNHYKIIYDRMIIK